jgi:ankyrin repeat protein
MTNSLPPNPSLENLKKQAKTLKKAWQQNDPAALQRIGAVRPNSSNSKPRLADCQFVLARECGFNSWPQLKAAVESARHDLPDQFVDIACLCHDDPHYDHRSFHARAHEMLRQHPWLAEANIWSAAAAGNAAAVGAFLDHDPDLVNRSGIHGWAPLICACYSRVAPLHPAHSTFAAARVLLDRGADPNAHTLKGNADDRLDQTARRFTALTGVIGGGSTGLANQPPHPHWRELAELLLERGADPADEQALQMNAGAALDILLRYGLQPNAMAPGGITLLGRTLWRAARIGNAGHVRSLLAHHARLDERWHGETPWQQAMARGHLEIARMLEAAGAPTTPLSDIAQFVNLCLAGDADAVRTLIKRTPDLLSRAPKDMVQRAVGVERVTAVALALDLGFDPNWQDDNGPIHMAGTLDQHEDILQLLLARGASLKLRDPWYDSTGIGWADFFEFTRLRDRLLSEPDICLFDALEFGRFDRIPDILARDPAALKRPFAECLSRPPKPEDWQTPLERMNARGNTEAARVLTQYGAV